MTDYPAADFVDELIAAYPDAKVILTVRDNVEVWHKSVMDTIWQSRFAFGVSQTYFQAFMQWMMPKPPGVQVLQKLYQYTFLDNHPKLGRQAYLDHNAHVRALAPKGKFLEFNVKQGWGPLCEFLEVPIPDTPFPRVNETKDFREFVSAQQKYAAFTLLSSTATIATSAGAVGLIAWYAWLRFR